MRDSISILGPITKSADDLLHEIPAILRSLDAVEGQRGSAEDVQVAVTADTAFVLDDILCTNVRHLSERLGFGDAGPTEVVIDGSAALYQAATKAYPGLWNKLRQDLQVLANSFSREEWTRLRDHLITKWKDVDLYESIFAGILPTLNFAADRRALKTFFDDWEEYIVRIRSNAPEARRLDDDIAIREVCCSGGTSLVEIPWT